VENRTFFQVGKAASQSEKILRPKRQRGIQPDLACTYHLLPVTVDPGKSKGQKFLAGNPATFKR
jgi:hypothetical protein